MLLGSAQTLRGKMFRNRYFLCRHGESESNVLDRISCNEEIGVERHPLTGRGKEQVRDSATRLLPFLDERSRIICSPYLRTRETAEIIAAVCGLGAPEIDRRLRERECPDLNGWPSSDFRKEIWEVDKRDPLAVKGETVFQVLARMSSLVEDFEQADSETVVILVTHHDPALILHSGINGRKVNCHFEYPLLSQGEWRSLLLEDGPRRRKDICPTRLQA